MSSGCTVSTLRFADSPQDHTGPLNQRLTTGLVGVAAPQPPACRTILVVDDDRDIRVLQRFILEESGYSVLEARDGYEALATLRANGTGRLIVLLDYRMPRMDGWELMRAVMDDAALAGRHTFALVTANVDSLPPSFLTLLEEQAIPILAKPFHLDDLDALVQLCVARGPTGEGASPA